MEERIRANSCSCPELLIACAGYCIPSSIEASEQRGLDAHISICRLQYGNRPMPSRGPARQGLDVRGIIGSRSVDRLQPC